MSQPEFSFYPKGEGDEDPSIEAFPIEEIVVSDRDLIRSIIARRIGFLEGDSLQFLIETGGIDEVIPGVIKELSDKKDRDFDPIEITQALIDEEDDPPEEDLEPGTPPPDDPDDDKGGGWGKGNIRWKPKPSSGSGSASVELDLPSDGDDNQFDSFFPKVPEGHPLHRTPVPVGGRSRQ